MKKQLTVLLTIVLVGILGLLSLPIGGVEITTSGGHLSVSTNVALAVNTLPPEEQTAYASPDVATKSPTNNTGSAWTNPTRAYDDGGTGYANITSGAPSGNNTWGTYGFNLTGDTITQVRVRYDAWSAGIITFVNSGAEGSAASGNITLGAPASPQINDVWIAVVHSSDQVAHSLTDWTQVYQGNGGSTTSRLSVWYFRYAGSNPNLVVSHTGGQSPIGGILAFRGVISTGSPIDVIGAGGGGTDASIELAAVNTTVDGAMLVALDGAADNNARSTLPAGFTAGFEDTGTGTQCCYVTTAGNPDGSVAGHYKIQASAGPSGAFTDTQAAADPWASVLIALKPSPADEQIRVDVSWDGGTSWSSQQANTTTGTEATYWYDVTGATTWTPATLNDTNFRVRVDAYTVGTASEVRLDWIPVEVTYSVNVAPTVGTMTISPSTMTPQEQWTNITVPVTDNDTLADVNEVHVEVFYDSAGNDPSAPGTADVQTCAILTWTRGGSPVWSLAPASTTWAINAGGCSAGSDSATTDNWVFSFKVGKVATHSPGSDDWDIYAKATDSISQTGDNYLRDVEMNWYGEINVTTTSVDWGIVSLGSTDVVQVTPTEVNITYICNGNYKEQVKSQSPWNGTGTNQTTLNTTGAPGAGEFSLKADDDATIADAVQVLSASYTTFDTGTQTSEAGNPENNNHLWLSLGGSDIPFDTYNGTLYYQIAS